MSKRGGLLIAAGVAAAALAGGLAGPAAAAPLLRLPAAATTDYDRDVFFFGGRMTSAPFGQSFNPFNPWYENNFIVGGGYQQFPFRFPYDFRLGVEAGLAGRFGDGNSLEVWGGGVIRYDGFTIGDVRISPAFTAGMSAVSGPIGVERAREAEHKGDNHVLFYLGPEISLSLVSNPNWEVFVRGQHRSGAWGTLGNMGDSGNADVVGLRFKF